MGRDIFAVDVETASKTDKHSAYGGLEPWRLLQGSVFVTSISVCRPDRSIVSYHRRTMGDEAFEMAFDDTIDSLSGQIAYAHNAVFDVAWMIGSRKKSRIEPVQDKIRRVKWHDTMLLAKWITNGQRAEELNFSLSLSNLIKSLMPDHPLTEEFVRMKEEKVDPKLDQYWERRNELDVIMTRELAEFLETKLPDNMRNGYTTEMKNIAPVANSWITGFRIDQERLLQVEKDYVDEQQRIVDRIQIDPSVLTSPKQLGNLLFKQLRLTPESFTPTGSPSTRADDIKMIGYRIGYRLVQAGDSLLGPVLTDIIRYKQIATLRSKYIDGTKTALSHTGDGHVYGAPRIFGTYTGRYTYSSKTLDTWLTGIAWHQIPRKAKEVRSFILPPDGCLVYEADASGQESRIMGIRSRDESLIQIFNNDLNIHSMTGSFIIGMEYEEFTARYKSGDPIINEKRQMGKLANLSCNFRIGGDALAKKAFEDYDMPMTPSMGYFIVNTIKTRYCGIPAYWDEAIRFAKATGYTETFGGRRYKIHDWGSRKVWVSESSALMFPIQSGGASMKNIAITEIYEKAPESSFALDLHDASFVYVPEHQAQEQKALIDGILRDIDYSKYWGFEPPIKLPYESLMGSSFADVK